MTWARNLRQNIINFTESKQTYLKWGQIRWTKTTSWQFGALCNKLATAAERRGRDSKGRLLQRGYSSRCNSGLHQLLVQSEKCNFTCLVQGEETNLASMSCSNIDAKTSSALNQTIFSDFHCAEKEFPTLDRFKPVIHASVNKPEV